MRTKLLLIAVAVSVACASYDDPMNTSAPVESSGDSVADDSTGAPAESSGHVESSSSVGDESTSSDASTSAAAEDSTGAATGGSTSDNADTGGKPSPECVEYCDEFMPNCNELPDVEAYDDLADCLESCESFAHGPVGAFDGDTVECRIAHLTFDPNPGPGYYELHCFHAQEHPAAQCV